MFVKIRPAELEKLGLSRKSERYRDTETGAIVSKRQVQKARAVGSYNKAEKNQIKQASALKGAEKKRSIAKTSREAYKAIVAKEQAAREKKRAKNVIVKHGVGVDHDLFSVTVKASSKTNAINKMKVIRAQYEKQGFECLKVQLAFEFDEDFANEARYKYDASQDKESHYKSLTGSPDIFENRRNVSRTFERGIKKGIRPKRRAKWMVRLHFLDDQA